MEAQAMALGRTMLGVCADFVPACSFPLAAPTGAVLQGVRRGSRYWPLRATVRAAVSAAAAGMLPRARPHSDPADGGGVPSRLEVLCSLRTAPWPSSKPFLRSV